MCAQCNPLEYECHYCGEFSEMDYDNEKKVRSEYDGRLETILVCNKPTCNARYAHRLNSEGLAMLVQKVAAG